jgi:hypothetical protein
MPDLRPAASPPRRECRSSRWITHIGEKKSLVLHRVVGTRHACGGTETGFSLDRPAI